MGLEKRPQRSPSWVCAAFPPDCLPGDWSGVRSAKLAKEAPSDPTSMRQKAGSGSGPARGTLVASPSPPFRSGADPRTGPASGPRCARAGRRGSSRRCRRPWTRVAGVPAGAAGMGSPPPAGARARRGRPSSGSPGLAPQPLLQGDGPRPCSASVAGRRRLPRPRPRGGAGRGVRRAGSGERSRAGRGSGTPRPRPAPAPPLRVARGSDVTARWRRLPQAAEGGLRPGRSESIRDGERASGAGGARSRGGGARTAPSGPY